MAFQTLPFTWRLTVPRNGLTGNVLRKGWCQWVDCLYNRSTREALSSFASTSCVLRSASPSQYHNPALLITLKNALAKVLAPRSFQTKQTVYRQKNGLQEKLTIAHCWIHACVSVSPHPIVWATLMWEDLCLNYGCTLGTFGVGLCNGCVQACGSWGKLQNFASSDSHSVAWCADVSGYG